MAVRRREGEETEDPARVSGKRVDIGTAGEASLGGKGEELGG